MLNLTEREYRALVTKAAAAQADRGEPVPVARYARERLGLDPETASGAGEAA
jgi:hypothetical protein